MNVKTTFKRVRYITLLVVMLFSAVTSVGAQTLSFEFKEVKLKDLLKKVTEQTGYDFIYSDALKVIESKVSATTKNENPEQFFNRFFPTIGVTHKVVGKQIMLSPKTAKEEGAQQGKERRITGVVLDSKGEPLFGVAVVSSRTKEVSSTNDKGVFELKTIQPGDPITISMIGMKNVVIIADNRAEYKITLEEDVIHLKNVIVTGYQTLSKERSAGSFKVVIGDELKDKANFRGNLIESLEGLSTGLSVNYGEGEEKILIRGVNSINSNKSVLYVVDGVAMSSSNIDNLLNSNDIASITLLKDATAASIWGARAANGVIVVTTKKGMRGRKIEVNYDGTFTHNGTPNHDYLKYMSSEMFIKNIKEIFDPNYYTWNTVTTTTNGLVVWPQPVVFPHEQILYDHNRGLISEQEMNQRLNTLASQNNRGQIEKYLMSSNFRTNHSLSVSGGGEKYSFYGSALYSFDQNNTRKENNKYAINLKQDFNITDWFKIDALMNVGMNDVESTYALNKVDINSFFPYAMLKDSQGNNLSFSDYQIYSALRSNMEKQAGFSIDYVPLNDINNSFQKSSGVNFRVNVGANIKIIKGLTFDTRYNYNRGINQTQTFYGEQTYDVRLERIKFTEVPAAGQTVGKQNLPSTGGRFTEQFITDTEWINRNQFAYDNTIKGLHAISAIAGAEIRNSKLRNTSNTLWGYDPQSLLYMPVDEKTLNSPGVQKPVYPNSSIPTQTLMKSKKFAETELRFVSVYSNIAYTYNSKYTLNGSVRVDQSNLFGSDPSVQFKPLWAIGGAWNVTKESFMRELPSVCHLVLRASYGLGGNSPDPGMGGPFDIILGSSSSLFSSPGYSIVTPANNKLIWEKTATFNLGIDFGLYNDRINGTIDIYNRTTTDLLNMSPVNPVTGWESTLANIGSLYNKGVELSMNSVNIQNSKFSWRTNLTFTYNKNRVTDLYDKSGFTATNMPYKQFVEGYPAYSLFAYSWAGLDSMGDPQVYNGTDKVKKYEQLVDLSSVKNYGSTQPLYFGALINNFNYKGVNLSVNFIYNFGHKMRRIPNSNFYNAGRPSTNLPDEFDNRWRVAGDESKTDVPVYIASTAEESSRRYYRFYPYANINVLSASYVKLRDITLSYSLPKSISTKLSVNDIKLKIQLGDLFLISNNKDGIDPEYHALRAGVRNVKNGPTSSFGINIRF